MTIFAVPKSFSGHIGVIQENAVRSWTRLPGAQQVLLLGDEEGVAEAAAAIGVAHEPQLPRNAFGTPLLDGLFDRVRELAEHDWLCYVNSDVILVGDLASAVRTTASRFGDRLLLSGRRWRVRVDEPLAFTPGWQESLVERATVTGWLDGFGSLDWFVFHRSLYRTILPFALGRTRWDAWLVSEARARGAPAIDATETVVAVHQEHRLQGDAEKEAMRAGPEATRNRLLARGAHGSIADARWRLTEHGLRRAIEPSRLRWRFFALRLDRGPKGIPSRVVLKLTGPRRFHRWFAR